MAGPLNWQDLQLFMLVARLGGLRQAADASGISASTASRRVTALERQLGTPVFERRAAGYRLNAQGRDILNHVERMNAAARDIDRLTTRSLPVVRLASGGWMARFLTGHARSLAADDDAFRIEWVSGVAREDIARRQAQIGVRNERPVEPQLAGRRLAQVAFAVYCSPGLAAVHTPRSVAAPAAVDPGAGDIAGAGEVAGGAADQWVTLGGSSTPSSRWVERQPGQIVARVSEPALILPLLHAGVGRAVLPCFIGDLESGLVRAGPPIGELAHEQWLVTHHDDRHLPSVRAVIERLVVLIDDHASLFAGAASS